MAKAALLEPDEIVVIALMIAGALSIDRFDL